MTNTMNKYVPFIIILLYGCENNNLRTINTKSESEDEYKFSYYNYCSPNLIFDDHVCGNTIIKITEHNNFLKCSAINDSEFVFSCGSGKKEVLLLKTSCGSSESLGFDGLTLPKLIYDDDEIMILYLKSGSDTWTNFIVQLSKDMVYTEHALYIDNERRIYVYLESDKFIIHDIMADTRDTIQSNYYKFRKDGLPSLHISDVFMTHDTLIYAVDSERGLVRDTIVKGL